MSVSFSALAGIPSYITPPNLLLDTGTFRFYDRNLRTARNYTPVAKWNYNLYTGIENLLKSRINDHDHKSKNEFNRFLNNLYYPTEFFSANIIIDLNFMIKFTTTNIVNSDMFY